MGRIVTERETQTAAHCKTFLSVGLKPAGEAEDAAFFLSFSLGEKESRLLYDSYIFFRFLLCTTDDPRTETGVALR